MRDLSWPVSLCLVLLACTETRTPSDQATELTLRTSGACEDGLCDASQPSPSLDAGAPRSEHHDETTVVNGGSEPAVASDDDAGRDDLYWESGASGGGAVVEVGTLNRCSVDDITPYLIDADSWGVCPGEPGRPATDCATAIRNTMHERQPFEVLWTTTHHSSGCIDGFVGVLVPGGHDVYQIHFEPKLTGFETPFDPGHTWRAEWTKCATFSIAEDCSEVRDCFTCVRDETSVCGCGRPESPSSILCVDSSE